MVGEGGSLYEGELSGGLPHGHGIKKEGRFMGSGAAVYTGEWEGGDKVGRGWMVWKDGDR